MHPGIPIGTLIGGAAGYLIVDNINQVPDPNTGKTRDQRIMEGYIKNGNTTPPSQFEWGLMRIFGNSSWNPF